MERLKAELGGPPHIRVELQSGANLNASFGNVTIVSPDATEYKGEYEVVPKVAEKTTLPTKGKVLAEDVRVLEIPIHEVSNESGSTLVIG